MKLGRIGVWTNTLDAQPASKAQEAARELEQLGYAAIWIPESIRREALSNAGLLLAATSRIVVATGIANIYARDAMTMAAGQKTLAEAYPGRFLLGLGVSHQPSVEEVRGHLYGKPVATMRAYLEAMAKAPYQSIEPAEMPQTVLAALGPNMLKLAAEETWGAHPYFVPVEHTRRAREVLGPKAVLAPEQAVVLETDPDRARAVARVHTQNYLRLPNYVNNLRRLGYSEEDVAGGGSDRLVDDVVAWGDLDAVTSRIHDHLEAGADHVSVQVIGEDLRALPVVEWRALAKRLLT
ncbi:MAG: LLM class F420-dependent oxidoreductase [Candidatus Dormibacteraeota bacterium]|nr:LLM class F420-dependent oxidoreductase [Candidatus Dormibacteraeota bacterium]